MSITVYTQSACQPCRLVKKRLSDAGIEFREFNILENSRAYEYVRDMLKANSMPVIVAVDRDPIIGFRPDQLAELIHDYIYEESDDE